MSNPPAGVTVRDFNGESALATVGEPVYGEATDGASGDGGITHGRSWGRCSTVGWTRG